MPRLAFALMRCVRVRSVRPCLSAECEIILDWKNRSLRRNRSLAWPRLRKLVKRWCGCVPMPPRLLRVCPWRSMAAGWRSSLFRKGILPKEGVMPQTGRLNKVIELLEQGKGVFGGAVVGRGNIDDTIAFSDGGYDFIIFEMEHEGFNLPNLRLSLQFLLNRQRLVTQGTLQPDVVPFVRVPPNAREQNQWVIKQTLDTGVYGLIVPHLDSVEQARAAVIACRYPQALGVADYEPAGQRGWAPMWAARYWGLSVPEYTAAADLWPLDPR